MSNKRKQLIFWLVYLAYTSIYIARVNLSVASPELIALDIADTTQIGLLGSAFSTVYAVGRLINGGISDRTPPWIMLTIGLVFSGLANLCIGFFPPFIAIFLLWVTNAYAQSMLWSSVLCAVSGLYDKEKAKRKITVMVSAVATGNIISILLNTVLIDRFGVQYAFIVPGALTVVMGAAMMICTRGIRAESEPVKKHQSLWELLKNRELQLMSIPSFFHGVMKENVSLWMAVFVVDTYAVDLSTSAYYILLIPVIGLIGRMAYPFVYKCCRYKENTVALIGFAACAVCAVLLCFSQVGILVSVLALSLVYAATSMANTSFTSVYPIHYAKTGNIASVSGIMDFVSYLGAGISSAVYGVVITHFGYLPMFVTWLVISTVSMLVLFKINHSRKEGTT